MTDAAHLGAHALDLAPFWLRLVAGFAAGAVTWLVAADYGCAIVSRLAGFRDGIASLAVGSALGYALLGSAVGILGLMHLAQPRVLELLLFAALLIRAPQHLRRVRALPEFVAYTRAWPAKADLVTRFALAVIAFGVVTSLINAALPAVWWDPIAYHLPLAASALVHGGFSFDPGMVQSGFPQLGEAAALPAYALAGSAGASMATLGAGLCALILVWALAEALLQRAGPLAAMLVASSALWAWLSPSFYVDMPFAMFVIAAIVTATQLQTASRHTVVAVALVVGALCGAAAGVKYTGLGAAAIVLVLALSMTILRLRVLAGFCSGFALFSLGWYLRTFFLTGDVVYPFWTTIDSQSPLVRAFAQAYASMTRHWCGGGTSVIDLVSLPYRLLADPRHFCGDPGFAPRTAVVFVIVAMFAVPAARNIGLAAVALTALWFASSQQWRFLVPVVLMICAISAAGVATVSARLRVIIGMALAALGLFTVLSNWLPQTEHIASASIAPAFAYIGGSQSAAQYLDERLETFAAARWLARNDIRGDKVVALDDVRDYYFPRGTTWANPFYQQAIAIDWQAPRSLRYQALIKRGIKYVVVNANPAYVQRTPTGIDWVVLESDRRNGLRELFSANGVSVLDVSVAR